MFASRELIHVSLKRRYYFHTIRRIFQIKKVSQFLALNAQTDRGRVEFMIRYLPDLAPDYGKRGKLLIDVDENLYLIPQLDLLPMADRRRFERYIYW